MDDLITARYAEILGGADQLNAGTGIRSDLLDEGHNTYMALGAHWDDAVYSAALTDHQVDYNMHTEDIALNQQTCQAMNSNVENYSAMQQRCMGGYIR